MKINITSGMGDKEEVELELDEISGSELLKTLGITIFEGTIIKNGTIVRESEILTSKDDIKLLKMIHGG